MAVHGLPTLHGRATIPVPYRTPPPGPPEGIGLDQILAMLRRRVWLIVATVLAGTTLAVAVSQALSPAYTATSAFMIDASDASFLKVLQDRAPEGMTADRISSEVELIRSRSHLERVITELDLFSHPDFQPQNDGEGAVELVLPADGAFGGRPAAQTRAALERLRSRLTVEQQSGANVINVSFTASTAEDAAEIANGVVRIYVTSQVEYKREMAQSAASWLEQRLTELQREVESYERQAAEYQAQTGLIRRPDGSTPNEQRVVALSNELTDLRAFRTAAEAKLQRAQDLASAEDGVLGMADVFGSPALVTLSNEEAALERQVAELTQVYGPRHPQMINLQAQLADARRSILLAVERSFRALQDEVSAAASREQLVREELGELQRALEHDQQEAIRLREIERQAEANRRLYEMFLGHYKEAQDRVATMVPDARVISWATPPPVSDRPGSLVFAMIGFTVSLMFGPVLALVMERLERRVQSAASIEHAFGISVLGLLPRLDKRWKREDPGGYINKHPFSSFAEAGRSIISSLRLTNEHAGSVIMVTSALPGEGKSTLSVALAASAARSGLRTLLVDLDLRRPSIEQRLGVEPGGPGLTDYLAGKLAPADLIRHIKVSDIDFVSVGPPAPNPLELLQSSELQQLFLSWERDYDQIIVDSAPALAVTDTKVAARLVSKIVLAVRWRDTEVNAVGHALRTIIETGSSVAGCVLTMVSMRKYRLYGGGEAGAYYKSYRRYYQD